jgi:hypothetical protein
MISGTFGGNACFEHGRAPQGRARFEHLRAISTLRCSEQSPAGGLYPSGIDRMPPPLTGMKRSNADAESERLVNGRGIEAISSGMVLWFGRKALSRLVRWVISVTREWITGLSLTN